MTAKSIRFFAADRDLDAVLEGIELRHCLSYVECGLFDDTKRPAIPSLRSLPRCVGETSESFLVLPDGLKCSIRTVPQRRGGVKYAVDQMANPGTVVLNRGVDLSESLLVAGSIGTIHTDRKASMLMEGFASDVKSRFHLIKAYWVGPEARTRLERGARLVTSVHAPREYDLSSP